MEQNLDRIAFLDAPPDSKSQGHRFVGTYSWEGYRTELRRFVARQFGNQDADDVVQEIYRSLLGSEPRDAIQNPRAWIFRIAWRVLNNACQSDRHRRSHHQHLGSQGFEELIHGGYGTAAPLDARLETAEEVLLALNALPIATQIAIVRSRRDGWSYPQIAAELGVSVNMVKKHITRAVAHFTTLTFDVDAQQQGRKK